MQRTGSAAEEPGAIAAGYDFIAVTERMNESLLVLMHLWGLRMQDVLYLSAKDTSKSAFYAEHGLSDKPDAQSARTRAYLGGDAFRRLNARDLELYEIANRRLDELVSRIPGFDALLERFGAALAAAAERCEMSTGSREDCVWRDGGCAWACIERLVDAGEGAFAGVGERASPAAAAALGVTPRDHTADVCG